MGYTVLGKRITLTRGDSFIAIIGIENPDGTKYDPEEGDSIRFAMKQDYTDAEPVLVKDIPIDTMRLILDPQDTKPLEFGTYVYDIQLTKANGDIDTFISKGTLKLTEEVD
jgi:hypothetical protein